ncbi:MAG: putative Adenosylmethionine decarboxylase [Herbaspirillum sp.]|jgi:S-adenosylmethionine/arginine decarboxylase-like enzyme|nr:putative Adenosylmethionine decarboxylase [Herbaspirillum sp.]
MTITIASPAAMAIATETHPLALPSPHPRLLRFREPVLQLQAVWKDCRQAAEGLRNADTLKRLCLRICSEFHLNVMGNAFFQFEPDGVAGTILLNGSHIAIHTWPEFHMLKADIHLPNDQNHGGALVLLEQLESYFQPAHSSIDRHVGHNHRPAKIHSRTAAIAARAMM